MLTTIMLFCVCCDLDYILSITEASFRACSEGLLADGGSQPDLPSVAKVGLWNSVGFGFLLSLWRNPRGSPWAQPSFRVRLKDHRHVQLLDIMARRGGRRFSTAVTGQLLPEGVQQLAWKDISNFCSLITLKEERTLLKWTLHCPQWILCLFSFLPLRWLWGSLRLTLRGVCGAEIGLYDLISSSCPARVNNNPCPSELTVSI